MVADGSKDDWIGNSNAKTGTDDAVVVPTTAGKQLYLASEIENLYA